MKDWKYILYLSIAFGLFVMVKLMMPVQYNWTVTFSQEDRNPYGGVALAQLMDDVFPKDQIHHSFQTIYELEDSVNGKGSLLVIAETFSPGDADVRVLLEHVEKGGNAFISAQNFYGLLQDTLKLKVGDYVVDQMSLGIADSAYVHFVNPMLDSSMHFTFRRDNVYRFFSDFDSVKTTVIARNDKHQPVTLRIRHGKGSLFVNSTPLAFTNIYLVTNDNHKFVSGMLSYLPPQPVQWTEFYQMGRMESQTPLRFILTTDSLRWAYFITIFALLSFMIFEMKRRQRIIPLMDPMKNSSLEFVSTIGNLYYANGQHKNIAEKKIIFFLENVRTKYLITTTTLDESFIESLSRKAGKPVDQVRVLVKKIIRVRTQPTTTAWEVVDLEQAISSFYNSDPL